jgi:hypothetical protein
MGPTFDSYQAAYPSVLIEGGIHKMWYFGCDTSYYCQVAYATSSDGRSWSKFGPVLSPTMPQEGSVVAYPDVHRVDGSYRMWYGGSDGSRYRIFAADSWNGLNWTKRGVVLDVGSPGSEDAGGVYFPRVLYDGITYRMWYTTTSLSVLLATSSDGSVWTKQGVVRRPNPSDPPEAYAIASPAVTREDSGYRMIYSAASEPGSSRLFYGSSADGYTWERLGLALDRRPPEERSIGGPSIAVEADGTWSVYYTVRSGTTDLQIYLATGGPPSSTAGPSEDELSGLLGVLTLIAPVMIAIVAAVTVLTAVGLFLLRFDRRSRHP